MESGESSSKDNQTGSPQKSATESGAGSMLKPFTKKNWDAIIDEFEKEEEKDQNINDLFKQIYEAGNEETRRAMNKSFQESGGTVLSTNWSNVADKKVEPKPPSENDNKMVTDFE